MTELQMSSEVTGLERQNTSGRLGDSKFLEGIQIYAQGFLCWDIWFHMAISEIRRRYRRTLLGPFWVTLSVAIFIGTMGILFPILWHTDVKTFLPFFSSGFIMWTFVSTSISDACGTFLEAAGLIKQVSLPYSVYANSVVTRNFLVLLHHLVVYVVIILIFHVSINLNTLLIIPAMIILCVTCSWVSIILGLLTARFRDIKQVIMSLLQIALFITPIFWMPSQLGSTWNAKILVNLNPLFHFVSIARAPMLGQQPMVMNWIVAISVCVVGWAITMRVLSKYHRHLVFWL